jgi:hypothetical protein
MNRECCKGLLGRKLKICTGRSGLPYHITNQYLANWGLPEFTLEEWGAASADVVTNRPQRAVLPTPAKEPVGDFLAKRINRLVAIRTGKGCGCKNLQNDMNKWGIEGCKSRRELIVDKLLENREMLIAAIEEQKNQTVSFMGRLSLFAVSSSPDFILRRGANWLLNSAIRDARKTPVAGRTRPPVIKNPPPRIMALSEQQKRIWKKTLQQPAPEPDPFTDTPVIHFAAHLWPVRGAWEWHVDRWNEIVQPLEGTCLVVIVVDSSTVDPQEVIDRLDTKFSVLINQNTPQGENPSFRRIQKIIPSGQNDVLLYAHGKGVRAHTSSSESVRLWTEMMYETILHNQDKVLSKLNDGYRCFGSFRSFGDMPLNPVNKWHYSGTFFAVRAKYLPGTKVKKGYGGVEAWPGDHIPARYAWCEFTDCPGFKFGYDLNAMYPSIVNQQMQWEVDRIGGPRCEQHLRELNWFAGYLRPGDRILVIGSKHGGLEHALRSRIDGLEIVSIDIDPQADNTQNPMIVGSSADTLIQEQARVLGPFDVVFIDGDHSYKGVKIDWQFAQSLKPRIIAFHDIAEVIKHRREGCEVDRLWAEIKQTHVTSEKIVGCGWGGIGVITNKQESI